MIHGRNASPRNILELMPRLDRPDFAYLAPAAANKTWYPFSFLVELPKNEPHLTSAIHRLNLVVNEIVAAGISTDRIVLLGFSQGACLAAEFAYRHATHYGGIVLFSGGLYLMGLAGLRSLGPTVPTGGLLFLAGWAALVVYALTRG
jgi:uncharacterized membrane protein YgdD (TMEM256/DUF423 family)